MWRYIILIVMIVAIGFVGRQIYGIFGEYRQLAGKTESARKTVSNLDSENAKLEDTVKYLSQPENLIKEIKSKFNYKFPDERTIIMAPER